MKNLIYTLIGIGIMMPFCIGYISLKENEKAYNQKLERSFDSGYIKAVVNARYCLISTFPLITQRNMIIFKYNQEKFAKVDSVDIRFIEP